MEKAQIVQHYMYLNYMQLPVALFCRNGYFLLLYHCLVCSAHWAERVQVVTTHVHVSQTRRLTVKHARLCCPHGDMSVRKRVACRRVPVLSGTHLGFGEIVYRSLGVPAYCERVRDKCGWCRVKRGT
jgi:hypothetical protein